MIRAAAVCLIAAPAAADVIHEPGGLSCDWWADQPSILGGMIQPPSAWLPAPYADNFWTIETSRGFGNPADWGAVWVGLPGRSGQPTLPVRVAPESPAPIPVFGIGALFAGVLAGIAIAWRLRK